MDLDETYGACLPPERPVRFAEDRMVPSTRQGLNSETGNALAKYLNGVSIHPFSQILARTTAILWLVAREGMIWFAMEEVRRREDETIAFVFPRRFLNLADDLFKLGHPSLIEDGSKSARIAGDIAYDPDFTPENPWVLTNSSGGYGRRKTTRPEHLRAVADEFARHGVLLTTYMR